MLKNAEYNKKNPASLKERKKREYTKNKRRYINAEYQRKYNISIEQFEEMLSIQKNLCAICFQKDNSKKGFHVDHCHISGKVRKILCNHCNRLIGACKENIQILRNSIDYLENHSETNTFFVNLSP